MTITELRKKRASVWESAKAFLDSHRQENGILSAEDDATYSRMEKEITDLGVEIARLERQEAIEAELSKPVNQPLTGQPMRTDGQDPQRPRATKAYREDFLNIIRGNKPIHNVLSTTPGSDGGYLVPEEFERQIITALEEENVFRKLAHAEQLGLLAVGIDIDHAFGPDGGPDVVNGEQMMPLTTQELAGIVRSTRLPLIIKGVLSLRDAERCLDAGAKGLLLSHHNNRIEYAVPPLALLPKIAAMVARRVPLFVDCEIQTGMDAFKALALGASGVCIGRPLMTAIRSGGADEVRDYLLTAASGLKKAMAFTGCPALKSIDPSIIHSLSDFNI